MLGGRLRDAQTAENLIGAALGRPDVARVVHGLQHEAGRGNAVTVDVKLEEQDDGSTVWTGTDGTLGEIVPALKARPSIEAEVVRRLDQARRRVPVPSGEEADPPKLPWNALSLAKIDALRRGIEAGCSIADLADELECSRKTVREWCRRLKLPTPDDRRVARKLRLIEAMLGEGMSYAEIARELGCTPPSVRYLARSYAIGQSAQSFVRLTSEKHSQMMAWFDMCAAAGVKPAFNDLAREIGLTARIVRYHWKKRCGTCRECDAEISSDRTVCLSCEAAGL